MIVGSKRDGRKIRVCLKCDQCGKLTQSVWIWDLALFFEGKEKRDNTAHNKRELRKLFDCEDFVKVEKKHFCAACGDVEVEPAQLSLGGVS